VHTGKAEAASIMVCQCDFVFLDRPTVIFQVDTTLFGSVLVDGIDFYIAVDVLTRGVFLWFAKYLGILERVEESIIVRIGDISVVILLGELTKFVIFVFLAYGGVTWWLWALGMAQIGDWW